MKEKKTFNKELLQSVNEMLNKGEIESAITGLENSMFGLETINDVKDSDEILEYLSQGGVFEAKELLMALISTKCSISTNENWELINA